MLCTISGTPIYDAWPFQPGIKKVIQGEGIEKRNTNRSKIKCKRLKDNRSIKEKDNVNPKPDTNTKELQAEIQVAVPHDHASMRKRKASDIVESASKRQKIDGTDYEGSVLNVHVPVYCDTVRSQVENLSSKTDDDVNMDTVAINIIETNTVTSESVVASLDKQCDVGHSSTRSDDADIILVKQDDVDNLPLNQKHICIGLTKANNDGKTNEERKNDMTAATNAEIAEYTVVTDVKDKSQCPQKSHFTKHSDATETKTEKRKKRQKHKLHQHQIEVPFR